jgi:nucleotide-binding universal stress UspA family protein
VVGIDGSPESALAAAVAFRLGGRFGAEVRPIAAHGGTSFDLAVVNTVATGVLVEEGAPVDALVAGAEGADLLVVGSRGLHGARALGSVSERVAHKAPCSVLVVRRPPS